METWTVTEARRRLPSLLDSAGKGHWQAIGRRKRREVILVEAGEIGALLGAGYRFHPQVIVGDGDVALWLPERNTHAVAVTLDEALRELADVMLEYARDWEERLRHAADHRENLGYVRRIELAGDVDGVLALLNDDSEADDAGAESAEGA
jgi:hypothetical protein